MAKASSTDGAASETAATPASQDKATLETDAQSQFYIFSGVAAGMLVLGVVAVLVFAGQAECSQVHRALLGVGGAASGAAALVGVLAGYLFGIPKTPTPNGDNGAAGEYHANTSMEQISDWVVKILVGLGLTQLGSAPDGMVRLAKSFERAVGTASGTSCPSQCCGSLTGIVGVGQFGAALMLYFAVYGFLFGYVHMRLYLAPAFSFADDRLNRKLRVAAREADRATQKAEVAKTEAKKAETVRNRMQEGIAASSRMLALLYQDSPQAAIDLGKKFLQDFGDTDDSSFWLRYACAWGQQARKVPANSSDFVEARDQALAASKRVIALLGEQGKNWLRPYWDNPSTDANAENDLAVFIDDELFQELLGKPSSSKS